MQEASDVAIELARRFNKSTQAAWVRIGLVVFIILFISFITGLIIDGSNNKKDCVFRIPRSAARPVTEGDGGTVSDCVVLQHLTSPAGQTLGLSGQESMPKNKGVLFVFKDLGEQCMWMKDMKFPLDVIWLNQNKEITYIRENLSPDTYPKVFCGPGDSMYFIEVNAGIAGAADLHVGQRLPL